MLTRKEFVRKIILGMAVATLFLQQLGCYSVLAHTLFSDVVVSAATGGYVGTYTIVLPV